VSRRRVTYAQAGTAYRDTLTRARNVRPRLKAADWAVLGAVFALTTSYSKTSDRTYVAVIAELAGYHERTVRDSLIKLDEHGVIRWKPRRGVTKRGEKPRSFVSCETGDLNPRFETGALSPGKSGSLSPAKSGALSPDNREVNPRRSFEERDFVAADGLEAASTPSRVSEEELERELEENGSLFALIARQAIADRRTDDETG